MTALNLLNLNVDTLFEEHGVAEIDIVHKKIQEVVEKKKEELRTMVGERYRDLLKAADTITGMQESTSALIIQIDNINGSCKNLSEQQLLGFKTETDAAGELKARQSNKQLNNYFSTMIQVKLLTSLPELIWSQLDCKQYYAATELFIFSRHISTGLQLDVNNPLMQKLPVAKKQWEILKPFHMTIKQQVLAAMEQETLSLQMTADCILALLQVERCTLENALKTFLNLRCSAFLNCLRAEGGGRVKERILASLIVLNDSLDLVAKCFLEKGLVFQKLKEHIDTSSPPTITRMHNDDIQFLHLLPDIITNFKPKFDAITINKDVIKTILEQWLSDTHRIANNQLKLLFDLVSNMNTIQAIKNEANLLKKNLNLQYLNAQFQTQTNLDFYELRYVPLINQRIRNIINDTWSKAVNECFQSLERILSQQDNVMPSTAISMWEEQSTDLPLSLAQALNEDMKIKKLLMKTKGYDSEIIKILTTFDDSLNAIIKEMNILLEEPTAKLEDKHNLVEFLRETAQKHLTDFISNVKKSLLTLQPNQQRHLMLFVVRICCALMELCPNLKICFCQQASWRQLLNSNASSATLDQWQTICGLMEDEIYQLWLKIIDGFLLEYNCDQYLNTTTANEVILADFTHWETIKLEQKDEQNDQIVQSTFRIPTQPRISLQSYFHTLIIALNRTIPQTLPCKVLKYLNQKLIQQFLKHYHQQFVVKNDRNTSATGAALSQNIALQLYFDLKFLQNSFDISRQEKEQFVTLLDSYKEFIDPFDFELFSTQLSSNIKRSVLRLHGLLGILTPSTLSASLATSSSSLVQEKDPNVLSLCSSGSTSLWFPLLPVVTKINESQTATSSASSITTETARRANENTTTEKNTTPTRKVNTTAGSGSRRNETKTKSGAASFFGAMSQEWFR